MAWLNLDGLYVKSGTEEGTAGKSGIYLTYGPIRTIEWTTGVLNSTNYAFGSTIYILDDNVIVPKGYLESVDVWSTAPVTSSGSPTIDFGLISTDRATEIDYDGFIAAETLANLDGGGEGGVHREYRSVSTDNLPLPAAGGALLGTTTTSVGLAAFRVNTANFTAGVLRFRLNWRPSTTV